jgi:acetylxylan esterase
MMSNIMAATYPDLISAVSLYSGVPAGCFSGNGVSVWNNNCSGGNVRNTPEAWATIVKNMYPSYNGTRPKMQIWHGGTDGTLRPQNYNETIKQWTAVFGVSQTPTNTKANTPESGYTTYDFGENVQGIYAPSVGHSVPSHLKDSEAWFGLT